MLSSEVPPRRRRAASARRVTATQTRETGQTLGDPRVRLSVVAGDPTTEVFVINSRLEREVKGLGRVDIELPPGSYKAKFKAGSSAVEVPVFLRDGQSATAVVEPPPFIASPAPLDETVTTLDYQADQAAALSQQPAQVQVGSGSRVLVMIRDIDGGPRLHPGTGVTLEDLTGKRLASLRATEVSSASNSNQAVVGTVALDPGNYRLSVSVTGIGVLRMTVVASPNWETHVFLLRRQYGPRGRVWRADLPNAAIFMVPLGRGFEPGARHHRWMEQARLGLTAGRRVVSPELLRELLAEKFESPMLGILGANLLWEESDPDLALLREVTLNLRGLLGEHPDVVALEARLGTHPSAPFTTPPMLRTSWEAILDASRRNPTLIPADSVAGAASTRRWGTGAWLVWRDVKGSQSGKRAERLGVPDESWYRSARSYLELSDRGVMTPLSVRRAAGAAGLIPEPAQEARLEEVSVDLAVPPSIAAQMI